MSVETDRASSLPESRFARLTATDLMFLRLETPAWPCHFGGLAILEAAPLLDGSGQLLLDEIRERLDSRLTHVPDLRKRVHHPGLLGGRPAWVDDDRFAIEHHVHAVAVAGGDDGLLDTVAAVYGRALDRSRPLWELWFLTGFGDDRVGVLLKLHHCVADGLAAVAVMGSLFDFEPDATEPAPVPRVLEPIPSRWAFIGDNLSVKARSVWRALRGMTHLSRAPAAIRGFVTMTRGFFGSNAAPGSSLNQPVQRGRLVRSLRLDLEAMKGVAHASEGKLNDVVLALWTGGLRHLLLSRGESVANLELVTGMAATLRSSQVAGTIDNRVGTMVLRLPVSELDSRRRLDRIVETTKRAKAEQRPSSTMGYLAGLAGTPIGRYFVAHQKASNTIVTNVTGPTMPVYMFGARILEILPIIELVGNIGLTVCAFSYAGRVSMVVTADAAGFPDIDTLMDGMEREWGALSGTAKPGPPEVVSG